MPKRYRPTYPAEFREQLVALVRAGRTPGPTPRDRMISVPWRGLCGTGWQQARKWGAEKAILSMFFRCPLRERACSLTLLTFAVGCGSMGGSLDGGADGSVDAGDAGAVPVRIESRERIVSEDGELRLLDGSLSIRAIKLYGAGDTEVNLFGPAELDLTRDDQTIAFADDVPAGSYDGIAVELGPVGDASAALDVQITLDTTENAITARYEGEVVGEHLFAQGPIELSEEARIGALVLTLTQAFFYLHPYGDAVAGHFELTANHLEQLTTNLVNSIDIDIE